MVPPASGVASPHGCGPSKPITWFICEFLRCETNNTLEIIDLSFNLTRIIFYIELTPIMAYCEQSSSGQLVAPDLKVGNRAVLGGGNCMSQPSASPSGVRVTAGPTANPLAAALGGGSGVSVQSASSSGAGVTAGPSANPPTSHPRVAPIFRRYTGTLKALPISGSGTAPRQPSRPGKRQLPSGRDNRVQAPKRSRPAHAMAAVESGSSESPAHVGTPLAPDPQAPIVTAVECKGLGAPQQYGEPMSGPMAGLGQASDVQPLQPVMPPTVTINGPPVSVGLSVLPYRVLVPSPDPSCGLCGVDVGTVGKYATHFRVRHSGVPLIFECRKCGRSDASCHPISCHAPKCGGVVETPVGCVGGFTCESCQRSFTTAVGLTQHKRHAHTALYRLEVSREARDRCGEKLARQARSEKDAEALRRLTAKYKGHPYADAVVARLLGEGMTRERVRDSRRQKGSTRTSGGTDETPDWSDLVGELSKPSDPSPPCIGVACQLLSALEMQGDGCDAVQVEPAACPLGSADLSRTQIESSALRFLTELGRGPEDGASKLVRKAGCRPTAPKSGRRAAAKREYRNLQVLFQQSPAKAAATVLGKGAGVSCKIPASEVTSVLSRCWGGARRFSGLGQFRTEGRVENAGFRSLISAEEVHTNLRRMNSNSATGPDGVTKQDLVKWDPRGSKLARLFNTWFVSGILPGAFKHNISTLIPKTTDPAELLSMGHWRPITVGSTVLRLYSRILTIRLAAACPMSPRQKGFVCASGCSENLMCLQGLIGRSRTSRASLAVVSIDFAGAFDTVSHEHILGALRLKGLDDHVLGLIRDSYVGCASRVKVEGGLTPAIDMRVGVKQGDPMSPLLFNVALDPLIQTLERSGQGFDWEGLSVTTLAFADDLVLVSGSWDGMTKNIAILEAFCELTGMRVQPRKCFGFMMEKGRTPPEVVGKGPWRIGGEGLRMISPGEAEKYLGLLVSPEKALSFPEPMEKVQEWVLRIGRAALKPSQKVEMLNRFAVTKLLYQLDHGGAKMALLVKLDGVIRKAVKGWLHLPQSTCDGLLYSRRRDGGLGVFKLSRLVPSVQVRRILRLSRSEDPLTRKATLEQFSQAKFERLWLSAGGRGEEVPLLEGGRGGPPAGPTAGAVMPRGPVPCDWRREEFLAWMGLKTQGLGVSVFFNDRTSSCWLGRPADYHMKEGQYIAGLQLRANVFPTLEAATRGRGLPAPACRGCHGRIESCSHILGRCRAVKDSRISRHNKVCALLASEATRAGWEVTKEPRIVSTAGELRVPDLVFTKGDVALVVDVTIRFEFAPDTLENARAGKVAYYKPIASELIRKMEGVATVKFFGFPVGARGKWPSCNNRVLRALGISKARGATFAKLVSRRALLYSLDILRDFHRLVGR